MKVSKSVSMDTEQIKEINRWMEYNGVEGFSDAMAIIVKRGLRSRKNGVGGIKQEKLLVNQSDLKELIK